MSLVALLLCTAFTFSWLTSKIDYLNTVIRMGDFGATVNVYYENGKLLTTGSTSGDDVVVNNAINDNKNWAAGTVGYRFVEVKNTGTINLNSYMSFAFDCENFAADNNTVADSFYLNVKDISKEVKGYTGSGDKLKKYIDNYKADSAAGIHKVGNSFNNSTSTKKLGMTVGGGVSYYLVEYCCYDLSSLAFTDDSFLAMGAKIRVQQADAPEIKDDAGVITGNGKKHIVSSGDKNGETATSSKIETTAPSTSKKPIPETTVPVTQPTTQSVPSETNPQITTTVPVNEWDVVYLDSNKDTCKIAAYRGNKKNLKIPTKLNGALVTSIGGYAFIGSAVEELTVPATVGSVDFTSFDTDSIKEVKFSKTTKVDGVDYASPFVADNDVIYSSDKSVLLKYMVQNDDKSYTVDTKTVAIADNAFSNVKKLNKLDLSSVKSVSASAFYGAEIKDYIFHTAEAPMISGMEAFGPIQFTIGKDGKPEYKAGVKLHIPKESYDIYKNSVGFMNYEKAKAICKDSELGSGNVGTEKEDGIVYTIIKNNTEYNGVMYSSKDTSYVAVVTGYDKIPGNGVVKIVSSVDCKVKTSDGKKEKVYKCPVVGIADNGFKNAKGLKMLVLPNKDIYYTSNAFTGCDNLGLIDYDSVLPFDVSKFDALLENIKVSEKENKEKK